ncbi:hemerythrin domain-containing protein [Sediminibacterium soli]|uniref:hemerythrin domain-containing protein n=1 Tax=Sediminibacterium soli TaxID=2698829 RepID=UPI00137AB9E2|nr:hemerythrin domain-containing protein [Sediminibacterium soli]NCI46280.1 hemerythrin domain-containing protein [Sediminibacterium soli]
MKPNPIKRSNELAPLSRDHHHGLLLCWKIRAGIKNSIAPERIAGYLVYCFDGELREHFRQEETLLFSLLPDEDDTKKEALKQHDFLYSLEAAIAAESGGTDSLLQFADALEAHIRFEERQLFPYIEQTVAPLVLQTAGELINKAHHPFNGEWADAFWIKK